MRVLLLLSGLALAHAAPQVQLARTTLIGSDAFSNGQEFFGGIPFAQPPVGKLRFAPPVGKFSLNVPTFDASAFGAACPQPASNISEDCLTINILRPANLTHNASLPVMVWVYGGSFFEGSASQFNASAIVAQSVSRGTPIIYVNFNYRVGALGFPQGNEAAGRRALNLGLKDQLMALEWVQKNIGNFGGDRHKVTVFGESAGAIAVAILFLNPSFGKLARAAIFESGSATSSVTFNASRREEEWQNFATGVPQCAGVRPGNTFGCLQSANISTILSGQTFAFSQSQELFPFVPVIDGPGGVLPEYPTQLWARGHFARLPFIAGTNKDEGTAFTPSTFSSTAELREWIVANNTPITVTPATMTAVTDDLLQLYPNVAALGSPFGTGNDTFGLSSQYKRAAALLGDVFFQAPRRAWIRATSRTGVKAFGYLFTEPQPTISPALGVTHATDLPYVYGQVVNGSAPANQLSKNMIDYWISFATSLDPNDKHGNVQRPHWAQYTPQNEAVLELNGADTKMIPDNYRQTQIDYINANPAPLHQRRMRP